MAVVMDTETLLRLAEEGRKTGYNRQVSEELNRSADPNALHAVVLSLPHEHIAGQKVDLHYRLMMKVNLIEVQEPITLFMDVSAENYRTLHESKVPVSEGATD